MTRAQLAEQFDREEIQAAESLALTLGIKDAGSWDAYVALRDGQRHTDTERNAA